MQKRIKDLRNLIKIKLKLKPYINCILANKIIHTYLECILLIKIRIKNDFKIVLSIKRTPKCYKCMRL